ncbi:MAG: hypothetical protein ACI4PL_07500, partial [Faecousia sp.]
MSGKEAAHGFRNLSVYKLSSGFEQQITDLKTKFDQFVNKSLKNRKLTNCCFAYQQTLSLRTSAHAGVAIPRL